MANAGYIYALMNESMPSLVKIGRTNKTPKLRAEELFNATGVPTPFTVVFHIYVSNSAVAETQIHELLERYRVSGNREFFRVPLDEVSRVMLSIALADVTKIIYKIPQEEKQELLGSEQSAYEWWSVITPKRIIEYNGKPCHFSSIGYSYAMRGVENNSFKVLERVTNDEQKCLSLKDKIKIIDEPVPTESVDNDLFWIDYLENLTQKQYQYIQF